MESFLLFERISNQVDVFILVHMITNLYAVVEADCSSLIKTSSWTKSLSEHVFVVVLQMLSIDEILIIKKKYSTGKLIFCLPLKYQQHNTYSQFCCLLSVCFRYSIICVLKKRIINLIFKSKSVF